MNGVTSIDIESLRGEVGKVSFDVSTTKGTYQAEYLTTEYIASVFGAIETVKQDWETSTVVANGYARRIEEYSSIEPESPIEYSLENVEMVEGEE